MLDIVSPLYRWLALVALAIAFLAFGFMEGVGHEESAEAKRNLEAERATVRLANTRAAATSKVELKYTPALTQIRTVTKETIRYVPQFVRADDCPMSGGFRLLHDAAAQGRIPDPAGIPDAAAAPAQDVAATVADNYGTCLENAKQLEGLQQWILEQQRLNPPAALSQP